MNNNIRFPDGFVGIKGMPGYFWNDKEKQLYSMKVTGVLKPLCKSRATPAVIRRIYQNAKQVGKSPPSIDFNDEYYRISHKGKKRTILVKEIATKLDFNYVIPVQSMFRW